MFSGMMSVLPTSSKSSCASASAGPSDSWAESQVIDSPIDTAVFVMARMICAVVPSGSRSCRIVTPEITDMMR